MKDFQFFRFVGEELGRWSKYSPTTHKRGTLYRVFRHEDGTILLYRHKWDCWSENYGEATLQQFASLEALEKEYGWLLQKITIQ
jgi:hypothetical protein